MSMKANAEATSLRIAIIGADFGGLWRVEAIEEHVCNFRLSTRTSTSGTR